MAIPARQIGWSTQSNLLWSISKELERLLCSCKTCPTTTTTTTISYYYYSGNNCNSPLFSQIIRSIIPLSIYDVVLATDGSCYSIGGVYVGPDYSVEYISTETCFVDPCPTTTTTTTSAPGNIGIAASTDFDIVGDFTIEFFLNMANANGFPRVYSFGAYPAPNAISIEGGASVIYFWGNGAPAISGTPGSFGIDLLSGWHHIAIVGVGSTLSMYVDGYPLSTASWSTNISSAGLPLTIGFGNEPDSYFNGYLSNFRWTDSAVYTGPFNGSVPTSPLSVLPNTKLLIFQGDSLPLELTDNSGNGHNATNAGANFASNNPFVGYTGSLQMGSV